MLYARRRKSVLLLLFLKMEKLIIVFVFSVCSGKNQGSESQGSGCRAQKSGKNAEAYQVT